MKVTPVIDETIPVLLRVRRGDWQSVAIAALSREDEQLYAEPHTFDRAFGRFQSVAIDETRLELVSGIGGNPPVYHHHGILDLHKF